MSKEEKSKSKSKTKTATKLKSIASKHIRGSNVNLKHAHYGDFDPSEINEKTKVRVSDRGRVTDHSRGESRTPLEWAVKLVASGSSPGEVFRYNNSIYKIGSNRGTVTATPQNL